jgi:multiple sugar transport system permease protein
MAERISPRFPVKSGGASWKVKTLAVVVLQIFAVFVLTLLVLGPFYWIVASSLKETVEILLPIPTLFPEKLSLIHYEALFSSRFRGFLGNSIKVSLLSVLLTLVVSSLAAYSLHRPPFPGKSLISKLILATYLFPGILLLVPLYQLFYQFGLIDSLLGIVVVNVAFTAPLSTWLLASFFTHIPQEVQESALLDGASRLRVLTRIILPLLRPGLASVALFAFIFSWQEYMFSSVFLIRDEVKTLPLGLATLMTQYSIDWGLLSAGAVVIALPVVLLFVAAGRQFVEGLISGSIK